MSTALATATGSAPAASSTPACSGNLLYDSPSRDANCAMPYGGNNTEILKKCCKDADIISYYDNCGVYCLALGQSVGDLTTCLFENGASHKAVFCRGNLTASATATGNADLPASAKATVVASGGASRASDDEDSSRTATRGTGTGSSSTSTSTSSANAAPGVYPPAGINTLGLTLGALLLSAATLGALQI
ncbi:uncharacterized protein CTRU02_209555 [Colletotrichum truncatum]|uniref:Uncharacterized protein n=1 Tax=Colletotrichum truncatum TaxID=5467 RepID=A0ACC3YSR0_COLTU|nr:uncharacterized protein CTRU02_14481 [Colletotrichum truncatum]KAF6782151.1 hypothetical protein CTRU02_14481 [Colletotrichum truncatum]